MAKIDISKIDGYADMTNAPPPLVPSLYRCSKLSFCKNHGYNRKNLYLRRCLIAIFCMGITENYVMVLCESPYELRSANNL